VATALLTTAIAYTAGSVFFGVSSDRLASAGVSRMTTYKIGLVTSLAMFALLAAGVTAGLPAILAVYAFTAISVSLAYALLTPIFPPEMTGRVITASNVMMFGTSFLFQWGIGAVLRLYPEVDGRYAANARVASFAGAFPITDPRYAVFVMIDEPKGNATTHDYATGGWVAAPTVRRVVEQIGPLLGVEPVKSGPDGDGSELLLVRANAKAQKLATN